MTLTSPIALRRGAPTRAKFWHSFRTALQTGLWKGLCFWRDPRQSLPNLTDQQAQDIGLDTADLEWRRLQLPSQSTRHPML